MHVASIYIFAVHRFAITYDPLLSEQAADDIDLYVNNCCKYGLNFEQLDKDLQQTFACIASITCHANPNGVAELTVQAVPPMMKLNEAHAVTVNNDIVPLNYYDHVVTAALNTLRITLQHDEKHVPQIAFDYVQTINEASLNPMTLTWKHNNEIHISCDDQSVQCICNAYITPNKDLLDRCTRIAHEVSMKLPSATSLLADVRFNDQIVISKIKS